MIMWCFACYIPVVNAQTSTIAGSITNKDKPVSNISITLLKAADSSLVKFGVLDSNYRFHIINIPSGTYRVVINGLGWKSYSSETISLTDSSLFTLTPITLVENDYTRLGGVTVTAKKALIEQKPGRMTINIEAAPTNAGNNIMEILAKSPGISLDKNGSISLNGKKGVLVLLDGKPTYLNGQELGNYLSGLSSLGIEKIEIMSTPPARYDAAGSAGIINIMTKKLSTSGFNGNATLNYSQGIYAKYGVGLNLNYYSGKYNFFFNGNSEYNTEFLRIPGPQDFYDNTGKVTTSLDGTTASRTNYTSPSVNVKTGLDYYLTAKTTVGVVLSVNNNNTEKSGHSDIAVMDHLSGRDSLILQKNYFTRRFTSVAVNTNFSHKINDKGGLLTVDLDYLRYTPRQTLSFNTQTFHADQGLDNIYEQKGTLPFRVDIYSGKSDLTHVLPENLTLNAGIKSSYVVNDNLASYLVLDQDENKWLPNPLMSRRFRYYENINAAYVMLKKNYAKVEVVAGLRAEHTHYRGNLTRTEDMDAGRDSSFSNGYLSLFPSASITYNMSKENTFALNYGRKVDRPNYYDLNPFIYYITPYTSLTGNPNLRPQYSDNIELFYAYKSLITTTLGVSNTTNAFENLSYLTGQNIEIKPGNIGKIRSASLSVNAHKQITGWWSVNLFLQGTYNDLKGAVADQQIHVTGSQFSGNMSHTFEVTGGWSGEVSGFYKSRVNYLQGVYLDIWSVNAAISKKVKDKITIKAGIADIFYSQIMSGIDYLPGSTSYYSFYNDSRRVVFSLSYKVGKRSNAPGRSNNANKSVSEANRVK